MKISKQARRDAKMLFRSCLREGVLDEPRVLELVRAVLARKPRGYLAILSHFQRMVKLDIHRRTARIESPAPLAAPFQSSIQGSLTRIYGRGLTVSFTQDASLVGGLRIQVGSDVYDGSIRSRLLALQESF